MKVDFLICGRRGFNVLQSFVEAFGAAAINTIASYPDKKVLNDPYEELVQYCLQTALNFTSKKEYTVSANIYRLVIGWQYLLFVEDGKTIVFHDSLLPKYRGFAPLVNSLINGEKEIGVTAFIATEDFDEGPIIRQESIAVTYPVTIAAAMELITPLYIQLATYVNNELQEKGGLRSYEQDHYLSTYSLWRDELDFDIDWNRSSDEIKRKIDAVGFPYQGAKAFINTERIVIKSADLFADVAIENRDIGKVIFIKKNCPVVVCNRGLLKITEAFYEDGRPLIPFNKIRSRFH